MKHLAEVLETVADAWKLKRQVGKDARELTRLGAKVRTALDRDTSPAVHIAAARKIARQYRADVADGRGLCGLAMGLRFSYPPKFKAPLITRSLVIASAW